MNHIWISVPWDSACMMGIMSANHHVIGFQMAGSMIRIAKWFWLCASVLVVAIALFVWPHFYAQAWLGPPLKRDLGFDVASPWYRIDGKPSEVFELSVAKGGPFERAGVCERDIPIDYMNPKRGMTGFFRDLEAARGRSFTFRVVPGGDGPAFAWRPLRIVAVDIPRSGTP